MTARKTEPYTLSDNLLRDLRTLIADTRQNVAQAVNSVLVMLYWKVGQRIRRNILKEKRAAYSEEILPTLSAKLVHEYGEGFSQPNLFRMVRFAEVFMDEEIAVTLSAQLGWNHFVEIILLKYELHRAFYAKLCRIERWSVRMLRQKIGGTLYERTALSKKPDKLIKQELDTFAYKRQVNT